MGEGNTVKIVFSSRTKYLAMQLAADKDRGRLHNHNYKQLCFDPLVQTVYLKSYLSDRHSIFIGHKVTNRQLFDLMTMTLHQCCFVITFPLHTTETKMIIIVDIQQIRNQSYDWSN